MIRNSIACVFAFTLATTAVAQPAGDEGLWQDEQYVNAYRSYIACVGARISDSSLNRVTKAAADTLFRTAFAACASAREQGTKIAQNRAAALLPGKSIEYRESIHFLRHTSLSLGLKEVVATKGLSEQFQNFMEQNSNL